MNWWTEPFQAFGLTHAAMLLVWAVVCVGVGRCVRRDEAKGSRRVADGYAGLMLGWGLLANLWWMLPERFEIGVSLPLHVCDLASLLIPFALWIRSRVLLAVGALWGLGLSTQGFVTPTLDRAPSDLWFWLFWFNHGLVVCGCFAIAGIGFRPRWADWVRVVALSVALLGVLMLFNLGFGTNYGYVGSSNPGTVTIVDRLGAWPMRVGWLFLLACIAMGLVVVCWGILRWVVGYGRGEDAVDSAR